MDKRFDCVVVGSCVVDVLARPVPLSQPIGAGRLTGHVDLVESLGADTLIYANVSPDGKPGVQLVARQNTRTSLHPGDAVSLDIAPQSFHLFSRQGQALSRPR